MTRLNFSAAGGFAVFVAAERRNFGVRECMRESFFDYLYAIYTFSP